jgi:hypothetical protein
MVPGTWEELERGAGRFGGRLSSCAPGMGAVFRVRVPNGELRWCRAPGKEWKKASAVMAEAFSTQGQVLWAM